jgi:TusA-related sulfurtransferase
MSEGERIVDVRGESCGMPVVRVEKFLKENAERQPFTVLGDHRPLLEPLQILGARHGWTVEIQQDESGNWRARFEPAA